MVEGITILSQALLLAFGILVVLAMIPFMYLFATKLRILGMNKLMDSGKGFSASEWAPVGSSGRNQSSRVGSTSFTSRVKTAVFKTLPDNMLPLPPDSVRKYLWRKKLPIRHETLAQLEALASRDAQTFAVLTANKPPSVVLAGDLPSFGVSGLHVVGSLNDLHELQQINESSPIVATWHNHRTITAPSDEDLKTFASIDSMFGTKLHVIHACTRNRTQIYCLDPSHGPMIKSEDRRWK